MLTVLINVTYELNIYHLLYLFYATIASDILNTTAYKHVSPVMTLHKCIGTQLSTYQNILWCPCHFNFPNKFCFEVTLPPSNHFFMPSLLCVLPRASTSGPYKCQENLIPGQMSMSMKLCVFGKLLRSLSSPTGFNSRR